MSSEPRSHAIETMLLGGAALPAAAGLRCAGERAADIYERDFEEFWETEGRERVTWFEPFTELLEWEPPYAKWYLGGKLNICFNCVDRHVEAGQGEKVAYHWEGEPEDERRTITFADLQGEVVKLANALKKLGVEKGTAVGIYMGMVPEVPVAMLACARLGAPHTVVFGGFSADSLSGRLNDMGCEVLITQDEAWRKGSPVPLKRERGRGAGRRAGREARRRPSTHRERGADDGGARRVVARARGRRERRPRPARASRWTPRICSTCSTRAVRPRSRRGSRTRPPATWSASRRPTTTSSTSSPTPCTGARRTSAG